MDAKKYALAAVGAPVAVAKLAYGRVETLTEKLSDQAAAMRKSAGERIDGWAVEGEKVVKRVGDTKTIDELAAKVDFDSVQEQVHKLRDQIEDLMATWRANFKPAAKTITPKVEKVEVAVAAAKPGAKKPAAKKPAPTAAKKPAAKKPAPTAAKKTTVPVEAEDVKAS